MRVFSFTFYVAPDLSGKISYGGALIAHSNLNDAIKKFKELGIKYTVYEVTEVTEWLQKNNFIYTPEDLSNE